MTEGQRRKRNRAIKALAKKQLAHGTLGSYGSHCAIGELLFVAGVQDHCLNNRAAPDDPEKQVLLEKYGLTEQAVNGIMSTNDSTKDRSRTRAVINYIVHYFKGHYVEKPPEDSCASETTPSQ